MGQGCDKRGNDMNQMAFDLNLGPMPNPYDLFWCCGSCMSINGGRMSLTWQPPDYKSGSCIHCGRVYTFESPYGEDELVEATKNDVS